MPVSFPGIETTRDDVIVFPPDQLDSIVLGLNLRAPITVESIESLALSIASEGQKQPGVVYKDAQKRPALASGYRRLFAINKAINADPTKYGRLPGFTMPFKAVFVRGVNEDNAWKINLAENTEREFGQLDKAYALKLMMGLLGKSMTDACGELKLSITRGSQLLSMLSLPDAVLRLVQLKKLAEANARFLTGLPNDTIRALAARVDAGDLDAAGLVAEATRAHRAQGDAVRRTWSQAKRVLDGDTHPAVAFVADWFAGDIAEEALIELFHSIPESAIERLYQRFRIDAEAAA